MKSTEEIFELEKLLLRLENLHASFDYLRVTIASPERIKSWSERILPSGEIVGEVLRPETINFRTHQPEIHGLFCEKIFGPIKNWQCKCGKFSGFALDKVCDECNVEIIEARVRRYRMGYIDLTYPVAHLWYLKGIPNYLCILLRCFNPKLSIKDIEQIVYFKEGDRYIDHDHKLFEFFYTDPNERENQLSKIVNKDSQLRRSYTLPSQNELFKQKIVKRRKGAEIIKAALERINMEEQINELRSLVCNISLSTIRHSGNYTKHITNIRRIRILESFLATKINPSWMILTVLPVLPPNLRPLVELESGRLVAADVNEIYRLIITRNQRLFDFLYHFVSPDLITILARKLLQEGVDCLIDNARLPKEKMFCLNNKALKSLTEILEGKQGRFRQSLLGKRVDYSGRSVIIVGPNLRLNQCGLPYEMATELFQPFLINELLKTKIKAPSHNTKLAHVIIRKNKPFVWTLLTLLTQKHCVLLNRAPTLHRFGIQAFDPVLVLGQAIHLHPLVCTGFNADFDGDQMAVHLPLYEASQLETRTMMRPSYNVLSPSNGEVILKPTQDMVIGCYYLTLMVKNNKFLVQKWFTNDKEALIAFYKKKLTLHTPILVRYPLANFKVSYDNGKLKFLDTVTHLESNQREIFVNKIFKVGNSLTKYYFITNIGVLISHLSKEGNYEITDLFLETSPGRLIFSTNFINSITK